MPFEIEEVRTNFPHAIIDTTLNMTKERFDQGNIQEGRAIFDVLQSFGFKDIAHEVYKKVWEVKGSPDGNPIYGEQCFHHLNGLSASSQELAKAIERVQDSYQKAIGDITQIRLLYCSLSGKPFKEPATLKCGDTFEYEKIKNWLNDNPSCPKCSAPAREEELIPNVALKALASFVMSRAAQGEELSKDALVAARMRVSTCASERGVALRDAVEQIVDIVAENKSKTREIQEHCIEIERLNRECQVRDRTIASKDQAVQDQQRGINQLERQHSQDVQSLEDQNRRIQELQIRLEQQRLQLVQKDAQIAQQNTQLTQQNTLIGALRRQVYDLSNMSIFDRVNLFVSSLLCIRPRAINNIANR